MEKHFRVWILLVVLLVLVITPAALANEKVTIRYARQSGHDVKQIGTLNELFDGFQKQHPEINLVQEIIPGDELQTKISTDTATRNLPDIFDYWGFPYLFDMVEGDMLLDIEEYLGKSNTLNYEDIPESAWDYYRYKGKIWGIPTERQCAYFLCNQDLFNKYGLNFPKTYEEMLVIGKKFNEQGIIPTNISCKGSNPGHFWLSELYYQFPNPKEGLELLRTECKFDTESNRLVAKLIEDQRKNGLFPKDTIATGDWGPSFALYTGEKAAMCYSWTWMTSGMPPEIEEKSVIIDIPKMPGAVNDPKNFIQGGPLYGFVINKESFNNPIKQKAVISIADFLVSDEFNKIKAKLGTIPTKKDLDIDWEGLNPFLARVLSFNEHKQWNLAHFHYWPDTAAWDLYELRTDQLWAGHLTAEEFVRQVQEDLDKFKARSPRFKE